MPPLTRANVCSLARNRIRLHGHGATVAPHASPPFCIFPAACGRQAARARDREFAHIQIHPVSVIMRRCAAARARPRGRRRIEHTHTLKTFGFKFAISIYDFLARARAFFTVFTFS